MKFEVAVVVFLVLLLEMGVNAVFPYQRGAYEQMEPNTFEEGCPPAEDAKFVSTLAELQEADENGGEFALKVDGSKMKQTGYAYRSQTNSGLIKNNAFIRRMEQVFAGDHFELMYVVELEDGNRILVRLVEYAVKIHNGEVILPIGSVERMSSKSEFFSKIEDKYDVNTVADQAWYVDASGYDLVQSDTFVKSAQTRRVVELVILGVVMIGTSIFSALVSMRLKQQERASQM